MNETKRLERIERIAKLGALIQRRIEKLEDEIEALKEVLEFINALIKELSTSGYQAT